MEVKCKRGRRVLVQLRGGTTALEVETGRWQGVKREERVCRNFRSEEVRNVEHWLLRCSWHGRGEGEVDNNKLCM